MSTNRLFMKITVRLFSELSEPLRSWLLNCLGTSLDQPWRQTYTHMESSYTKVTIQRLIEFLTFSASTPFGYFRLYSTNKWRVISEVCHIGSIDLDIFNFFDQPAPKWLLILQSVFSRKDPYFNEDMNEVPPKSSIILAYSSHTQTFADLFCWYTASTECYYGAELLNSLLWYKWSNHLKTESSRSSWAFLKVTIDPKSPILIIQHSEFLGESQLVACAIHW